MQQGANNRGRPWPILRARLALWPAGWMFLVVLGLVLLLNGAYTYVLDHSGSMARLPVARPVAVSRAASPEIAGPTGQAGMPPPAVAVTGPGTPTQLPPAVAIRDMQTGTVRLLWLASGLALVLALVVGGGGSILCVRRLLRYLDEFDAVARRVTASTLDGRIALEGAPAELVTLAASINAMLDRLQCATEEQQRFLADIAHELRTPVAVLRTNLDVRVSDPPNGRDDYQQMVSVLRRSVQRLERLIEQLVLVVRDVPAAGFEPVALGPLVEDIVGRLQPLADQRQVHGRMQGDGAVVAVGDPLLLGVILANLLSNALEYNRPGGSVRIRLAREDTWALVAVEDTGLGIPPALQGRLFARLLQGDATRERRPDGLGLGLAIVQRLVRQHNGNVSVASEVGAGSTFTVRLPAADAVADLDTCPSSAPTNR